MPDRWRVLITARSVVEVGAEPLARLRQAGVEIIQTFGERPLRDAELAELVGAIDGIIAGLDQVGPLTLQRAVPRLKVVARNGVGIDTVDVSTATHLGIAVTNAPGVNTEGVADLVFGLMIGVARHLVEADRSVRDGRWARVLGTELYGNCLGLVGFGRIARTVARRAGGFEMRVLAVDTAPDEAAARRLGVQLTSLDAVLAEGDFVSIHVPLAEDTRQLIGEPQLRRMRPTAYLINTARGGIVDEAALARALQEGWIAGAACDVFEQEPPVGSPLLAAPRLLLTPHIGAHTTEATMRGAAVAVENLLTALRGERPPNEVNPEVFGRRRSG
ncbi:MAG: phosphoglycerate dehydrogenase [Armatimonadetes bacterium]|nr:phosphoglycerate dehydrogenase [Armatimonadota bacterium]